MSSTGNGNNDDLGPFRMNSAQQIAIAIIPKVSGSISFICSSTVAYMILQSEVNLGTPFRRIIFIMCMIDTIQSLCAILSTIPSPVDSPGIWGAMGNKTTCTLNGFFFHLASTLSAQYICVLSIHYCIFVQNKIRLHTFRRKIEPLMHGIPFLWSLSNAVYLLTTDSFNQCVAVCWIAPEPYECLYETEIDCIRGKNAWLYRWIFAAAPNSISLLITFILMVKIYYVVKQQEEAAAAMKQARISMVENADSLFKDSFVDNSDREDAIPEKNTTDAIKKSRQATSSNFNYDVSKPMMSLKELSSEEAARKLDIPPRLDVSTDIQHQNEAAQQIQKRLSAIATKTGHRNREAKKQAFLFTGSFLLSYTSIYIGVLFDSISVRPPFALHVVVWIFFPLQGLFNIIVFTRPHVAMLMQSQKQISIWKAIWLVVKSGGDFSVEAMNRSKMKRMTSFKPIINHSSLDIFESSPSKPPSQIHSYAMRSNISSLGIQNIRPTPVNNKENDTKSDIKSDLDMMYCDNDYDIYDDESFSFDDELKISNFDDYDDISYHS